MHPRSLSRARITADTFRREPPRPALQLVRPEVAFGVVAGALVVTRAFEINWPYTGVSLAFAAGEQIHLAAPEDWIGGESVVIIVETKSVIVDPACPYRLTAVSKSLAGRGEAILGGFDLAPDCAVLAGSFWDANLESAAPPPAAEPLARRIADIFVARARDGFADTSAVDLVREGISERDAMRHYEAGAALAAAETCDTDLADDRIAYDRQARVMCGAVAIAGQLDPGTVNTTLHLAGLSTREIGNLFDDIIGESMRLVREARAALAAAL